MKDMLVNLKENPLKLALLVGGPVLLLVVIVVVVVLLMGGDSGDPEEVEFVFDDPLAEPVMTVEDQVALTVAAMVPTETPVPTPNVPLTLEAEARAQIALTPTVQLVPTPDPFASTLSAADIRYLDSLGHPVWLATRGVHGTHHHLRGDPR